MRSLCPFVLAALCVIGVLAAPSITFEADAVTTPARGGCDPVAARAQAFTHCAACR